MSNYTVLSIVGAGGHSRSIYSWLLQSPITYDTVQFIDAHKKDENEMIFNKPIVKIEWSEINSILSDVYILGIGDNQSRKVLYELLISGNKEVKGAMHQSSVYGYGTQIDTSSSIGPGVVIGPSTKIGRNCIINSGAIIEHETIIGNHSHLAPGAKIAGRVHIGDESFIGIGAVVKESLKIGNNVTVGAGSVVINDVPDNVTVVGIPAKIIRMEL
ncbi:N-acetylneuraminate synthase [Sporosarcina newyorkensis 2681]|uniref:N-acetylneuraminate synthase n=1 Tax=Sporosarcina newyorkensis 2681 TaxID=1027292 RepID=F9DQ86_9BACL|nr:acetyltransferase [Sporosarcina newyorkensis]EGQ27044.1 N-acetylneuraminate synthase [Sporosarcina newyorkensis 2681]